MCQYQYIAIVGISQIKLGPDAVKTSSLGVLLYQKASMKSGKEAVLQGPDCKNSLLPVVLTRIPLVFQTCLSWLPTPYQNPAFHSNRLPMQEAFVGQVTLESEHKQSLTMKMKAQWMSEDKLRETFKEQLGPVNIIYFPILKNIDADESWAHDFPLPWSKILVDWKHWSALLKRCM